jgi:hypothetical protein
MREKNNSQILTLVGLSSEGKKVARLSGNRNLDAKAVKSKMKSLKQCGMLVPAIIVDAKDAIDAGLEIIDFITGEAVTEANTEEYVVLVDANHRYQAHLNLIKENSNLKDEEKYNDDFYVMYPLNPQISIAKMLAEINIVTNPWKGGDFSKGAKMINKDKPLPLLDFITELTNMNYSLIAASEWATFTPKINKRVLARAMDGDIDNMLEKTTNLERGWNLLTAARKAFSEDFLKSRTLIDWVIGKYDDTEDENKATVVNKIMAFFESLSRDEVEPIEKAKGKRGAETKESIIYRKLDELFKSSKANSN